MRRELEQLQVRYEELTEEHQGVLEQLHRYEQPSEHSEQLEEGNAPLFGTITLLLFKTCSFLFLFPSCPVFWSCLFLFST